MARQRVPVKLNQFIGGLNTEANPFNYPISATIDERNFVLLKNGSRKRRKGFDLEENYSNIVNPFPQFPKGTDFGRTTFLWENAGGYEGKHFLVVQLDNFIVFHDIDNDVVSSAVAFFRNEFVQSGNINMQYANIDGVLVTTATTTIRVYEYDGQNITVDSKSIKVRDLFGVEDIVNSDNLKDPLNFTLRPTTLTDAHLYNLRNQGFALPRVEGREVSSGQNDLVDPVEAFYNISGNTVYPSNSENMSRYLFANPNISDNRTVRRFNAEDMFKDKLGNSYSPLGYFIIKLLDRGRSRIEAMNALDLRNPDLTINNTDLSLPEDGTESDNSIRCLTQFAGRIWYGGFPSTIEGGDSSSPRLGSYVAFSQVVDSPSQIDRCYQQADPTSIDDPDIVDTDGGFIKLDGAQNIQAMINRQNSLFVIAENGVWQITGSDDSGFTATNYRVSKISSEGSLSPQSVIEAEQNIMFWGVNGIYVIGIGESGLWELNNISKNTIQSLYDDIDSESKTRSVAFYDAEDKSITWLYGNKLDRSSPTRELIFDLKFNTFTINEIPHNDFNLGPVSIVGSFGSVNDRNPIKKPVYMVVNSINPLSYTFGGYEYEAPTDWVRTGVTVDSPAYLTTGYLTGGDTRLRKDVPYLTTYFERTEEDDPNLESGCLISSRWDFKSNVNTSRWSTPRQAYRPNRTSVGNDIIITKNRIRGGGNSVAFHLESEPGKTFNIYGWEHNLESTSEE